MVIKKDHQKKLRQLLEKAVRATPELAGLYTVTAAKRHCPVDKGDLRDSIVYEVVYNPDDDTIELNIKATASYASEVEYGSGPHKIEARDAKALRFVTDTGEVVFATHVFHPGSKPQPFIRPAVDDMIESKVIEKILRGETRKEAMGFGLKVRRGA